MAVSGGQSMSSSGCAPHADSSSSAHRATLSGGIGLACRIYKFRMSTDNTSNRPAITNTYDLITKLVCLKQIAKSCIKTSNTT